MTTRIETENSTYEVDFDGRRARRVAGTDDDNSAWPEDLHVWREYTNCDPGFFGRMFVHWPDNTASLTSPIQGAEEMSA